MIDYFMGWKLLALMLAIVIAGGALVILILSILGDVKYKKKKTSYNTNYKNKSEHREVVK